MKSTAVILSVFAAATSASAGLPSEWTQGSAGKFGAVSAVSGSLNKVLPGESREAALERRSVDANALEPYLNSGSAWIESQSVNATSASQKGKKRPWYLQSIKAELGVEAEGEIGFLGAEGEAAIELIWTRTRSSVQRLQKKKYGAKPGSQFAELAAWDGTDAEAVPADLTLSSQSSVSEIESEMTRLASQVSAHAKLENSSQLRSSLLKHVLQSREMILALSDTPDEWNWRPYKFQLQLFVQAEGHVSPIAVAGAVTRVRIEWNLVPRKGSGAQGGSSKLAGLSGLVRALDRLAAHNEDSQRLYQLQALKIGIGMGGELELGLAEAKGSFLGSVFLRREKKPTPQSFVVAPESVQLSGGSEIPYEKLQQGLGRVLRITDAITSKAELHELRRAQSGRERDFELYAIEVELEASTENGFVLASVAKTAAMEIFFVRTAK